MPDNKNISQIMIDKLSQRQDYMAWYMLQYMQDENLNDKQLAAFLETSETNIERLAMCKAPNSKSSDFIQKINDVGNFTDIDPFKLSVIVRKVESIHSLKNSVSDVSLMAARKKEDDLNDTKE